MLVGEISDAAAPLVKSKKLHKEREVLNALQPHPNLKKLKIEYYSGNSFPNWMGDDRCLSNLVSLTITWCSNCTFLPSLGQLPSLKDLFSLVVVVGCLDKLEEWSFIEGGVFPRLKKLRIESCHYLRCLPKELPASLSDLCIRTCPLLLTFQISLSMARIYRMEEVSYHQIKRELEETLGKLKLLLDNKDLGLDRVKNYKKPERIVGLLGTRICIRRRDGARSVFPPREGTFSKALCMRTAQWRTQNLK
ncbi:disease resistance protein RGA2-like [Cannabis sativa]|uniref:disease resistance protein RGA2-like n=1 Tax=Cannabis sativa TaxID=3483 RepID=UPI0029C9BF64|nr:disease resistance protein RGA2-like [Cannabis sativa]